MHKKDYIEQVMAYYKELERGILNPGEDFEIRIREPEKTWDELVDRATMNGIDNLELTELIRMADYAKGILR